jgi:hypothetical protein
MSWCRAQFGTFDQRYFFFQDNQLTSLYIPVRSRNCAGPSSNLDLQYLSQNIIDFFTRITSNITVWMALKRTSQGPCPIGSQQDTVPWLISIDVSCIRQNDLKLRCIGARTAVLLIYIFNEACYSQQTVGFVWLKTLFSSGNKPLH